MRVWFLLAPLLLAACEDPGGPNSACDDLCDALVQTCQYDAFPSIASCEQGCLYDQDQGSDIDGYLECVQAAECNTFDVVGCEREYGIN